jgi:hypothetical protein
MTFRFQDSMIKTHFQDILFDNEKLVIKKAPIFVGASSMLS